MGTEPKKTNEAKGPTKTDGAEFPEAGIGGVVMTAADKERQQSAAGFGASPFLPADQHFVRQVVLSLIEGRALASTSPLDEKRIESFVKQGQMALAVVKRAEQP